MGEVQIAFLDKPRGVPVAPRETAAIDPQLDAIEAMDQAMPWPRPIDIGHMTVSVLQARSNKFRVMWQIGAKSARRLEATPLH